MTIFCRVCQHKFQSLKPGEEAIPVVLAEMAQHFGTHSKQAAKLKEQVETATQLIATYLLIKQHIKVLPEEKLFLEAYDQNEQMLIELFGLQPNTPDRTN